MTTKIRDSFCRNGKTP